MIRGQNDKEPQTLIILPPYYSANPLETVFRLMFNGCILSNPSGKSNEEQNSDKDKILAIEML